MSYDRVHDRKQLAELVARQGSVAQAARLLGLPESTLRRWLAPVSAAARCECGTPLPDPRARRCRNCAARQRRRWRDEQILAARERWRALHGRPPSSYDWNPTLGPHYEAGRWPAAATVLRQFGSWSQFLAQAPGSPRAP